MIGGIHKYDDNKRTVLKSMIVNCCEPPTRYIYTLYSDISITTLQLLNTNKMFLHNLFGHLILCH